MSKATVKLLDDTADYIEENGWVQEQMYDITTGRVCTVGGMAHVLGIGELEITTDTRLLAACGALIRVVGTAPHLAEECTRDGSCTCVVNWVTGWNDDEVQSMQQVLDALRKAAKIERAGFDPDE